MVPQILGLEILRAANVSISNSISEQSVTWSMGRQMGTIGNLTILKRNGQKDKKTNDKSHLVHGKKDGNYW